MSIQRWNLHPCIASVAMAVQQDGEYVLHPDHAALIAQKDEEIKKKDEEIGRLTAKLAEEQLAFLRAQAAYDEITNDIANHAPQEYISGYLQRKDIDISPVVARVRQSINSHRPSESIDDRTVVRARLNVAAIKESPNE